MYSTSGSTVVLQFVIHELLQDIIHIEHSFHLHNVQSQERVYSNATEDDEGLTFMFGTKPFLIL